MDAKDDGSSFDLTPRPPGDEDLLELCRELNAAGARYIVIGGFAIRAAGYMRGTGDIDLLVDASLENEARVYKALESLPDKAVLALGPGEIQQYVVVRVADEVVVDLMASACGIDYEQAKGSVVVMEQKGVTIPFASPLLLWQMKAPTRRMKDESDLVFLRDRLAEMGIEPPGLNR